MVVYNLYAHASFDVSEGEAVGPVLLLSLPG